MWNISTDEEFDPTTTIHAKTAPGIIGSPRSPKLSSPSDQESQDLQDLRSVDHFHLSDDSASDFPGSPVDLSSLTLSDDQQQSNVFAFGNNMLWQSSKSKNNEIERDSGLLESLTITAGPSGMQSSLILQDRSSAGFSSLYQSREALDIGTGSSRPMRTEPPGIQTAPSPPTHLHPQHPTLSSAEDFPSTVTPRRKAPNLLKVQMKCIQIATAYSNSFKLRSTLSPRSSKDRARANTNEAIDGYIYQVRFKRAHRNFVLAPSAPKTITPGMFVKVEADRGEDLGVVLAKIPVEQFEEPIPTAGYRGRGFSSGQGERKFIYRIASDQEIVSISDKLYEEERVLQVIRDKVAQRKLPMAILDAEFQYDRHKLTFFFEADRRIDFRELVSELFSMYKTRIWMQQVDTSTIPTSDDPGTLLAEAAGLLPGESATTNAYEDYAFSTNIQLPDDIATTEKDKKDNTSPFSDKNWIYDN